MSEAGRSSITDWYAEWAARHALIFGLATDADREMLASWEAVFEAAGYTAIELVEASTWIAGNTPPKFRSDHLPAIRDAVRRRRAEEAKRNESRTVGGPLCHRCEDTGLVIVPHPSNMRDGRWRHPWYTLAVICWCPRGDRMAASHDGPQKYQKGMMLRDYEKRHPGWFDETLRRRDAKAAEAKATRAAEVADGKNTDVSDALEEVFARIRERMRSNSQ